MNSLAKLLAASIALASMATTANAWSGIDNRDGTGCLVEPVAKLGEHSMRDSYAMNPAVRLGGGITLVSMVTHAQRTTGGAGGATESVASPTGTSFMPSPGGLVRIEGGTPPPGGMLLLAGAAVILYVARRRVSR